MKKSLSFILTTLLSVALLFTGCAGQSTPSDSQSNSVVNEGEKLPSSDHIDVLRIGTTQQIKSASRSDYYLGIFTRGLVNMRLAMKDRDGNYIPSLADTWESEDGMLWKFTMRNDVYWHDGVKVTPEDVKFSIEYLKEQNANSASQLRLVESVNVTGDDSFEIQLSSPDSRFIDTFMSIIPQHVYENVTEYEKYTGTDANLGNGPYKITKIDTDAGILEMEATDDFYMGKPHVDKIVIKYYGNEDTLYMALMNQEIDMIYNYSKGISNSIIDTFKADGSITLETAKNTGLPAAIYLNVGKDPVNRIEVRRAMRYAIDYQKMVDLFGSEYASLPEAGVLPKGSLGYKDCGTLTRNLEKAKQELESIGCVDTDGDGIYELNGKKLEVEIVASTAKEALLRVLEIVKTNLEEAGIGVIIKSVDAATYSTIADEDHTHVALMGGATPAGMNTSAGAGTAYYDARYYGWSMLKDSEFQNLVDNMLNASSLEEYKTLVGNVQDYYVENIPIIPLYNDMFILAYNSKLNNLYYEGEYGLLNILTMYNITTE